MAHAHKGGISHSPGNNSRPQSNDTHHRSGGSPSDGRKQSRRIDPSEQQFRGRKRRHGAPLQRFLPWLAENATMGPLEASRSRRKSSKKSGEARKATGKPPIGPRMPCWTHAARPPIGVFCHPANKTAQPPLPTKKKPAKRYEHLAGFRSDALNPLRTQHVYWARKESRAQSTIAHEFILNHPSKHRFDMALRLFR